MYKNEKHIIGICLIALLFAISFFKDDFTPDYLNTPDAAFIGSVENRLASLRQFPGFWLPAVVYSAMFVLLPYHILRSITDSPYAKSITLLLLAIACGEYLLIFLNSPKLDTSIIPKINRFFHSPIFTLFFLAAFTINSRLKDHG